MDDFRWVWCLYETWDVYVDEGGHQILAIESVHNATVAWDNIAKVLDFEGSFEATGEETAKRANDRAEQWQRQWVQYKRVHDHGLRPAKLQRTKL